jgi:hypothetical protein
VKYKNNWLKRNVVFLILTVCFSLLFSLIPFDHYKAFAETTDSFGIKNEKVYNIDNVIITKSVASRMSAFFTGKQSVSSLNDLEGKLIRANETKIVRLVDVTDKGKWILNEGPNPAVITVVDGKEDFKSTFTLATRSSFQFVF